jgi:ATP-dependent exoDNAse (exonuclease V) beta subunit
MSKLQIYKASAGSGKTHLLTEFYLKLAFVFPDSFKHILAVTFTNKAADEMKGRILHIISNIIDNNEDTEHFDQLKVHLGISSVDLIEKAKLIRRNILHNFSDFHVGTIDSFIQRVIRAFAYELNLHSGYDIEFDTEKVVSDLTDLLSERIPEDENLKSWLIELIQDKIDDGLDVDIRKEIRELAKELFKEEYHRHQMNNAIENEVSEEREHVEKDQSDQAGL